MENEFKIRQATKEEIAEIQTYCNEKTGLSKEDFNMEYYYFIIIEDYISDCPCYSGKVCFAMYGTPEMYEVFIYDKQGKPYHIDTQLNEKEKER